MTPRDRPEFSANEPHFIVTAPVETTKGTPKRARPLARNADRLQKPGGTVRPFAVGVERGKKR